MPPPPDWEGTIFRSLSFGELPQIPERWGPLSVIPHFRDTQLPATIIQALLCRLRQSPVGVECSFAHRRPLPENRLKGRPPAGWQRTWYPMPLERGQGDTGPRRAFSIPAWMLTDPPSVGLCWRRSGSPGCLRLNLECCPSCGRTGRECARCWGWGLLGREPVWWPP